MVHNPDEEITYLDQIITMPRVSQTEVKHVAQNVNRRSVEMAGRRACEISRCLRQSSARYVIGHARRLLETRCQRRCRLYPQQRSVPSVVVVAAAARAEVVSC